jgi:hypothetical protein
MSDYNVCQTSKIWAALYEHQHHPGGIDALFDYVTKIYGIMPVYTITNDQTTYNLTGYRVIDETKHNLFLLKYGNV